MAFQVLLLSTLQQHLVHLGYSFRQSKNKSGCLCDEKPDGVAKFGAGLHAPNTAFGYAIRYDKDRFRLRCHPRLCERMWVCSCQPGCMLKGERCRRESFFLQYVFMQYVQCQVASDGLRSFTQRLVWLGGLQTTSPCPFPLSCTLYPCRPAHSAVCSVEATVAPGVCPEETHPRPGI